MMVRVCRHCRRAIVRYDRKWWHIHSMSARCKPAAGPSPVAEPEPEPSDEV